MKIPIKVKIAGYDYRVKYPYTFKNYKLAAEVNHDKHEIMIASHSSKTEKKARSEIEQSLLHEIVHAVNTRYLPRKNRLYEGQVEQISEGLYQVLKDNKLTFGNRKK
jgi:hypothetical protein